MTKYIISIETDTTSDHITSISTRREALKKAAYYRKWYNNSRKIYKAAENPQIVVIEEKKGNIIYCKSLQKHLLI